MVQVYMKFFLLTNQFGPIQKQPSANSKNLSEIGSVRVYKLTSCHSIDQYEGCALLNKRKQPDLPYTTMCNGC